MERHSTLGKYLILLGLLTDALCLVSDRGPVWPLGFATVLMEAGGLYLVFKNRKAKQ